MTTAREFCNRTVYTVRKGDSVLEAARRMREHHIGDVVIIDDKDGLRVPVGILTDRDLVVSVLAGAPEHIATLQVGDVVTERLIVARAEDSVDDVVKRMQAHGIRRMPVVDAKGGLYGIIAFDDVLTSIAGQLADLGRLLGRERHREEVQRS